MSKIINSYPTYNPELVSNPVMLKNKQYRLTYVHDGEEKELIAENTDPLGNSTRQFSLSSADGFWHPETHDTFLTIDLSLDHTGCLFNGDNPITYSDSTLGLALLWTDRDSLERDIVPLNIDIVSRASDIHPVRSQRIAFPKQHIRGEIDTQLVIYLKKNGIKAASGRNGYCNTVGSILGVLDEVSYVVAGEGSVFPIAMENDPDKPLWYVSWNSESPDSDQFSIDTVALVLNSGHPLYGEYRLEEKFNSPFMKEILCDFFMTLILQTNAKLEKTVSASDNYPAGTIADYVLYLVKTKFEVESEVESNDISVLQQKIRACVFGDGSRSKKK